MEFDFKKAYYYIICLITFFVLMWGLVDFASTSINLASGRMLTTPQGMDKEPNLDEYYQRRVTEDRLYDSLARILVSGLIFAYAKFRINQLERA
jgi:hypothetical protein